MAKYINITITYFLFILVSLLDLYAVAIGNIVLEVFFKPFLMMTLTLVYIISVKKPNLWFICGLFFSFVGDILLLDKENYFIQGLLAFLLAHLIYIKIVLPFLRKKSIYSVVVSSIPFLIIFAGVFSLIYINLGNLFFPVILYSLILISLGTLALMYYQQEKNIASFYFLFGVSMFIISDVMLGVHRFYQPMKFLSVSIMLTYIIGQYFICRFMISREE